MEYLIQLVIFILGTIIGSFLNVVILRHGKQTLTGCSQCPHCGKTLRWFELFPLASFLFLRGKCSQCQQKISWQYPLVELATGLIFWSTVYLLPFRSVYYLLYLWVVFSLFLIIFVYDLRYKIIPDLWVFLLIAVTAVNVIGGFDSSTIIWWQFSLHNPLWAGPLLALPLAFLWFISQGRWIGLGDAKLAWAIGWFLGLVQGSSALILGIWLGAAVGLLLVLFSKVIKVSSLFLSDKNFTIKSELPLAPFLIAGVLLVFFLGWNVWELNFFL